jgi:hypothetical protein
MVQVHIEVEVEVVLLPLVKMVQQVVWVVQDNQQHLQAH